MFHIQIFRQVGVAHFTVVAEVLADGATPEDAIDRAVGGLNCTSDHCPEMIHLVPSSTVMDGDVVLCASRVFTITSEQQAAYQGDFIRLA